MKKNILLRKVISLVISLAVIAESMVVTASAEDKLDAPTSVEASNITDSSLNLKWNSVSGADAYRVYLWNYDTDRWESKAYVKNNAAKITDLDSNTRCRFRIASYDLINGKYEKQTSSGVFVFKTRKEKLSGPSNLRAHKIGVNDFEISWDEVIGADGYLVWYRKKGTNLWLYAKNEDNSIAYSTEPTGYVSGLKSGELYEVCVKTFRLEDGKYAEQGISDVYSLQTRTSADVLPAHPNIVAKARSNRVDISYGSFNTINALTSYSIIEQLSERSGEWETIKDENGCDRVFEGCKVSLTNIKPNKTYKFRIITLNHPANYTKQDCSKVITIKTPKQSDDVWDGSADTSWYTGKKDAYDISTPAQLAGLAQLVNEGNTFEGVVINLTKNIKLNKASDWKKWRDFAPANTWTPIGGTGGAISGFKAFSGVFNGNGHTISGMYVTSYDAAGLFGYTIGAAIVNLKLEKSMVYRSDSSVAPIGGLIGKSQNSFVDSCEVDGFIGSGWNYPDISRRSMGGIIGEAAQIDNTGYAFGFVRAVAESLRNPQVYLRIEEENLGGTYVGNCKANDVTFYAPNALAASVVGAADEVYIYNCLSTNCTVETGQVSGAIIAAGKCEMKKCYYYNFNMTGSKKEQYDSTAAAAVSDNRLTSEAFAKNLGSAFAYSKGNPPKLRYKSTD